MQPPNQREVAQQAGVSQKTVSLALNGDPRISAATRRKVRAAARRLGYRPNPLLTALMSDIRRRQVRYRATIGVVILQPTRDALRNVPNLVRMLAGIHERGKQLGYGVEEFWVTRDQVPIETFHRMAHTRNINGLVLMTPHTYFEYPVDWSRFATSGIGCATRYPAPIHTAFTQSFRLVRHAWKKLQSLGFHRIGLVTDRYFDTFLEESLSGPYFAQQALAPAADRIPILLEEKITEKSLLKWYRQHRPEVILSQNTNILDFLRSNDIRVPEDVSLVNLAWHPKIKDWAGIDRQNENIGARALDLVVEQLNANERGLPDVPKMVLVSDRWIDGPTLAPGPKSKRSGL